MEDKHPGAQAFEVHEEFISHIESGSSKLRLISLITLIVSSFLFINYILQLVYFPYILGQKVQEVDLTNPYLVMLEVFLSLFSLLWLYVAVTNLLFLNRLMKQIREIRQLQKEIEKKIS